MHQTRNVHHVERLLSVALGASVAGLGFRRGGRVAAAAALLGGELIYRGATGFCPIYGVLGLSTAKPAEPNNARASVPYGKGIRVERSIAVALPASELYRFWRRLETLPHFMQHVEEVTLLTDVRSRWRVRAPIGKRITWEAEIINDIPDRLIAWRSLPGSAIHHAGSVRFEERGNYTDVHVEIEYAPPARYLGASLARLFGEDPVAHVAGDLQRFKIITEGRATYRG